MNKKQKLPTWETYCDGTTAANALVFNLPGGLRVWYSYKTPVAFKDGAAPIVVRQNDWNVTTGKHLNAIDGGNKKERITGALFESALSEIVGAIA